MDIRGVEVEPGDYIAMRCVRREGERRLVFSEVSHGNLYGFDVHDTFLPTLEGNVVIFFGLINSVRVVHPRGTVINRLPWIGGLLPGMRVQATETRSGGTIDGSVVSNLDGLLVVEDKSGAIAVGNRYNWERLYR